MKKVFVLSRNIVSPLGNTAKANFEALCAGQTSVKIHHDASRSEVPFCASLMDPAFFEGTPSFTPFESVLKASVADAVTQAGIDPSDPGTALILSSTKGNIGRLEQYPVTDELKKEVALTVSAERLAKHFGFVNPPVIVSHACISGTLAIITAKRLIDAGKYKTIVVAGADLITRFILSGFQSFHAVSGTLCKPFDANRDGINLGEAAATVVLSADPSSGNEKIIIGGGGVSNDANHISGPSRTGEELFMAIDRAMKEAGTGAADIDFISAHGTATVYNDDMESRAINLGGVQGAPVNSLKGYYGHTLGAAGLLETVISIESLCNNKIIPTKGFETPGTVEPISVCSTLIEKPVQAFLKTASGFGGCNAAIVVVKV
ncbi:beta-ketoacyl-[acyl-carrier-protein] synthase family protein [Niabella drilacis]|uniref:3-oxoacyl-[acyl-carrier-protein] synthase-1 n=1 Tax=Niabella drilacis (strain DSM 25811 / CCM 8410 / CCUG 62505 / LMG 26954 / E90) TaxID=1285928 RepID=A0A1G6Q7K7_NIADE|nr:beta-ketoacyl synthase N-terminal-like domain-containing protein [Niabella drilacis]SDC87874.1 3-oxoacyl-[acyl-carrier-protein] synthase-1 [Niabella drilacis]